MEMYKIKTLYWILINNKSVYSLTSSAIDYTSMTSIYVDPTTV